MPKLAGTEELLASAKEGDLITIVFSERGLTGILYLFGMIRAGVVKFCRQADETVLMAVSDSKRWGNSSNRRVQLLAGPKFDRFWFATRLGRECDRIDFDPQ